MDRSYVPQTVSQTAVLRLAAALALLALTGCPASKEGIPDERYPVVTDRPAQVSPELEEARARWGAAGMEGYRMTLRRMCFCPSPDFTGPFEVAVRDGEVSAVRLDGSVVDAERGVSVEALFALIDDAYARGAAEVEVAFHPELGYPTSVRVDYDYRMADEEIGYQVSDLRPL